MKMLSSLVSVCLLVASGFSFGCGGGTTGGDPIPPPPPKISVSVSCASGSIQAGSTDQCTPTVTGTSNTAVTWSVSPSNLGTVSTSGLFTAGANPGTTNVVATSVQDPTKSGSFTVTITTPPQRTITSITPINLYCDQECGSPTLQITGTGFVLGDVLKTTPDLNPQTVIFVDSSHLVVTLGMDTPHTSPGEYSFQDCAVGGSPCSPAFNFLFEGNLNLLRQISTGEIFSLDPAHTTSNGFVHQFKADGTPDNGFLVGSSNFYFEIDETDNTVLTGSLAGLSLFTTSGTSEGGTGVIKRTSAVAARNGIACMAQPDDNLLTCFSVSALVAGNFSPVSVSAGVGPWNVVMTDFGSGSNAEIDAVVYNRGGTEIRRYKITNTNGTIGISLQGGVTLTGITAVNQPAGSLVGNGGWQLAPFGSSTGPAFGKLAFLSETDKVLVVVDLASMTELRRVTLSGVPIRIAADETHGAVVVALADIQAGLTRFERIDMGTGAVTNLQSTANLFAVGLAVSADGTKIYAAMRDQLQVIPNP